MVNQKHIESSSILVVEDDGDMLNLIKGFLNRSGYQNVTGVTDVKSAMDRMRSKEFDLILLDWELPELNGDQLLYYLRMGGKMVPVMMVTGRSDKETVMTAVNAGVKDYIVKPFKKSVLGEKVRLILEDGCGEKETSDSALGSSGGEPLSG